MESNVNTKLMEENYIKTNETLILSKEIYSNKIISSFDN